MTDDIHTCRADCERPICVAVREAVEAEREACAKACEEMTSFLLDQTVYSEAPYKLCALAIRERGAP